MRLLEGTTDHALDLVLHLRQIEHDEIKASHGKPAWAVVPNTVELSAEAYTFLNEDNNVMCMTGVVPITTDLLTGGWGSPWLLNSTFMTPRVLLGWTKLFIEKWRGEYRVLVNHIDARYEASLRWAKWAGFTVHDAEPYGPYDMPFHRIEIRSD